MVSVLTIQRENFYNMWPESEAMRQSNHNEAPIALPDVPLNLAVEFYKRGASNGTLLVHTAREGSKLVGYHFSWVALAPHFNIKGGYADAYYVLPEYRGAGVGKKLIHAAVKSWEERDCKLGFMGCRTKEATNYTDALVRDGWTPNELTFVKKIGVWP